MQNRTDRQSLRIHHGVGATHHLPTRDADADRTAGATAIVMEALRNLGMREGDVSPQTLRIVIEAVTRDLVLKAITDNLIPKVATIE